MRKFYLAGLCLLPSLCFTQNYLDRYLTDSLTYTVIGNSTNFILAPRDLDVKPNTNEVWVSNIGGTNGSDFIIFYSAALPNQTSQKRYDTHSGHFNKYNAGIAFGDQGEFGTIGENQNSGNSTFMGPSLWSQDTAIFAKVFQNAWISNYPLGSHLSMLHQSPYGMGIAWDTGKVYWVADGFNDNIARYDFVMGHGPGYDNHSAGKIWRYTDVSFTRLDSVPSHMCRDSASEWLYFIDGGPRQLKRLNTIDGTDVGPLNTPPTANETLAAYRNIQGSTVEIIDSFATQPCGLEIYNGRLFVGDYTNGNIYMYDITDTVPVFMDTIVTGQAGMMGLKIGPDGLLWFVNHATNELVRINIGPATDDAAITEIVAPVLQPFEGMMPEYYSIANTVCSNTITPVVTLYNAGSATLTSAQINYHVDMTQMFMYNWTGSLAPGASVAVTLPSAIVADGHHHFHAEVSLPNGNPDENRVNDAKAGTFRSMSTLNTVPYSQDFSSPTWPPAGWIYNGFNEHNPMFRENVNNGVAMMDNYTGTVIINGQKDYLRMPSMDLTAAPAGTALQFDVAYCRYNTATNDRLQVWISTDCGGTWTTLYNKAGTQLATAPDFTGAFYPLSNEWRQETILLSAYVGMPDVRFMFVCVSAAGNNLFLDNVNVLDVTGIEENATAATKVYPSPTNGEVFIETADQNTPAVITVTDVLGQVVMTQTTQQPSGKITIDLSAQPAGQYFVNVQQGEVVTTHRVNVID